MKILIGIVSIAILLAIGTLAMLVLWGVYSISWILILRIGISILLVSSILVVLIMLGAFFFKKDRYSDSGNNARPMN